MRKFTLKAVYEEGPDYVTAPIKGSRHAAQTFEDKLQLVSEPEEMMYLITLDTRHCPTSYTEVARGSLNETIVHPREIFKRAIVTNSHAIIMVHNHPSGNVEPSPQDHNLTKRICEAGDLLGIKVLDHLIIAPDALGAGHVYYSFAENDCLK